MITPFTKGPPGLVNKLNEMVGHINRLEKTEGGPFINYGNTPGGRVSGVSLPTLQPRVPHFIEDESGTIDPIAWYLFNASEAKDSSGNDYHGTAANCTYDGDAFGFNGNNSKVDCGAVDFIGTGSEIGRAHV